MQKFDLLPCPFCGKLETLRMMYVPAEKRECVYHVACDADSGGCGASTGWNHETPEEAAKEWNTRASDWILYSEKRPNSPGSYLVYNDENGAIDVLPFSSKFESFYDCNVTHWMPLPEAPQRKDDTHDYD